MSADILTTIETDDAADHLLSDLADIEAEIARLRAETDAAVAELERRRSVLLRLAPALEQYCRNKLGPDASTKTVRFPHGSVNWRLQKGGFRLVDQDAALRFLDQDPDLYERCVTTTPKVKATEYLALVGQVEGPLPGVEYVPDREHFYINGQRVEIPQQCPSNSGQ